MDFALSDGAQVIGMSRSAEPHLIFLPYLFNPKVSNFKFCKIDLNHDLEELMEVLDDFKPHYVVNFAAQSMVAESWNHPEDWFTTNVVSNVKFHDLLRTRTYLKKYLHVSTPEVYGSCAGNVKEDYPYQPSTPYAVSRAACDMSLMTFFKSYNFPVVFTRAANVFGPGQQLYRIIPRTLVFIKLGKRLQLHGGGHSVRSFIPISDVSNGTLKVAREGQPGAIYHLSTPVQISIRDLVAWIGKKMGVEFKDFVDIVNDRPGKDAAYLLDSSKAIKELGWHCKTSLENGIDQTIAWVEENFNIIKDLPFDYIHKA